MTDNKDRAAYVAGLRQLAHLIESHPDLPLPTTRELDWDVWWHEDGVAARVARIARILPGDFTKNDPTKSGYDSSYYTLTGSILGLKVRVCAMRSDVCEKVVTTETVTETIPATEAVEAQPERVVTREVEHVEWVCKPLLASAEQQPREHEVPCQRCRMLTWNVSAVCEGCRADVAGSRT